MNLAGYQAREFSLFSGLVDSEEVTKLAVGLAGLAKNCTYHGSSVRTRYGIQSQWGMVTGQPNPITGLASLKLGGGTDTQMPLVYDLQGNMWIESPAGSGHLVSIAATQFVNPAGSIQVAAVYQRGYIAFTNLRASTAKPAVLDIASRILDPLSMRPVGEQFKKGETYRVNEYVTPLLVSAGGNGLATGRLFKVSVAGVSGASEPAWPNTDGGSVVSGGVTFVDNTPIFTSVINAPQGIIAENGNLSSNSQQPSSGLVVTCSRNAGAGAYAANRDIYIAITLANGNGETATLTCFAGAAIVNTVANDQLSVKVTTIIRAWIAALIAPAAVTGWNLYVADVATGALPPGSLTLYGKVGAGNFSVALNTIVTVNSSPAAAGTTTNNFIFGSLGDSVLDITPTIAAGKVIIYSDGSRFTVAADGSLLPSPGSGAGPPLLNSAFIVSAAGNIPGGTRFIVVIFVNRNGYFSGFQFVAECSMVTGNLQGLLLNVPLGPPETAKRVIALSPLNVSPAGPFFYIPANDSVKGIRITSTVINDNTSTTATFNFTEDYLRNSQDVTQNFRLIQVPACSDIQFSSALAGGRMVYKPDNLASGFLVSLAANPEGVYGDTGTVQVAENNGERLITGRDFQGQFWALKERSGHLVQSGAGDPSTWAVEPRWYGHGPAGPRAVDCCSSFMAYAHRSGAYIHMGNGPSWITEEIDETWRRINFSVQHLIWVHIDDESKELRIGVPFETSVVPNKILRCNYRKSPDFAPPTHMTLQGDIKAQANCRKWTIDDIPANICIRAERTIQNAPPDMAPSMVNTQILFGSSNPDGAVSAITPWVFNDNGAGIDWVYETSAHDELLAPSQIGAVQAAIKGSGDINFTLLAGRAKAVAEGGIANPQQEYRLAKPYNSMASPGRPGYTCGVAGVQNERFRLRMDNGRVPDAWGDVEWAAIYARRISSARPGKSE